MPNLFGSVQYVPACPPSGPVTESSGRDELYEGATLMSTRVKPNLWIAVGVFLGYLAIFFALWAAFDLDYDTLADTVESIRDNYAITLAVGAAFLVIAITALGWWRPTIFEVERVGPSWLWVVPVVLVIGTVISLATVEWSEISGEAALWLLIGSIGVGFNEEITTRGLLIVGGRSRFQREVWVVVLSCLAFGSLHLPNVFYGQSVGTTITQFIFASLVGVVYYVLRRFTGTLIVPMVLHGAWDGALFSIDFSGEDPALLPNLMYYIAIIASFVGLVRILREHPDTDPQPSA